MALFGESPSTTDTEMRISQLLQTLGKRTIVSVTSPPRSVARAADELAAIGEPAVEPLVRDLAAIGPAAAVALARLGRPALRPLLNAMVGGDPSVRELAMTTFGLMGDPEALPALLECRNDPDPAVRGEADHALRRLSKRYVRDLVDGARRDTAVAALERIGAPATWPLAAALWDLRLGLFASSVLSRVGEAAVEPLVQTLVEARRAKPGGESATYVYAASALASIGAPAVDPLIDVLRDERESEAVRAGAAYVLGKIGPPAIDRLVEATDSYDTLTAHYASVALDVINTK